MFYVLFIPMFLQSAAFASTPDAGLPGAYLNYIGGTRANAMGRAYVGIAEGADAPAWNPAGLGFLRPNTFSLSHARTVEQASLDNIMYAQPFFKWGAFGLGYSRLNSGALTLTDDLNRVLGDFRDVQETYMIGYGIAVLNRSAPKRILRRVAVGGTLKYSRQKLYNAKANGWGADIGVLAKFKHNLSAGMRIQNLMAPALEFETGKDEFPRVMTIGLGAGLWKDRIIIASDFEKALDVDQKFRWKMGLEGALWNTLDLRGGYDFKQKEVTFGIGYKWGSYEADYTSSSNDIGLSHRFGLAYSFGGYPVVIQADPETFSPVGLKKRTTFHIRMNHTQKIHEWILEIRNQSNDMVASYRGSGEPPSELTWDGSTQKGVMVAAGSYVYTLLVTDMEGRKEKTPPQIVRVDYGTPLDTLEMQTR